MTSRTTLFVGLLVVSLAEHAAFAQGLEPGISEAMARGRARAINAVSYDLDFVLQAQGDMVQGHVVVRFTLVEEPPSDGLVLDFGGQMLTELRVNGSRIDEPRRIHDHLVIPTERLSKGENDVDVAFTSSVASTGTALTRYVDGTSGRQYLYTLLVPADAHRLFPCFDQPDLKAVFTLRVKAPRTWQVVGNSPQVDRRAGDDGLDAWEFAPTERISTYLFAFAAGDFEVVESQFPFRAGKPDDRPMRMYLRPEERARVDANALFDMHAKAVDWLAAHFSLPYPFAKLDFVLLPGFPYGGMEHAGAIFYRDNAVSFDHVPTRGELTNRSALVYHEVSHQWFGNLVSFVWFDDLWLKEGFATFMGYRLIEALEPERHAWVHFHRRVKPRAYEVDVTPGTTPIYQSLANLDDAKSAYGAIVYNKAPAVLRELEGRLGKDRFRTGVGMFLREFAWRNATWKDLVGALERAAERPLAQWSEAWILRAGLPRVSAAWTVGADGKIASFELLQKPVGAGEQRWPLRLQVLVSSPEGRRSATLVMEGNRAEVRDLVGAPACDWVLVNPSDEAYGQFVLDARSAEALLTHLPDERDPLVSAVALSALRENVREGLLDPLRLGELVATMLAKESDPEAQAWLLDTGDAMVLRYASAQRGAPLRARLEGILLAILQRGEPALALQTFRTLTRLAGSDDAFALLTRAVSERKLPGDVKLGLQDVYRGYAALLAAGRGEVVRARLPTGDDASKWAYLAGAASPEAKEKERYFKTYLDAKQPPEQWVQQSLGYFHWPGQSELTLPYLARALEQVEWVKANRKIFFMPAWIDGFVNGHTSSEALAVVTRFLDANPKLPTDIRQKVLQSTDELRRTVRVVGQWR